MASTAQGEGSVSRRAGREEERKRLLKQINRGLEDIDREMQNFIEAYKKFVDSGAEVETRIASWSRFFKEVALVSEDRIGSGEQSPKRARGSAAF